MNSLTQRKTRMLTKVVGIFILSLNLIFIPGSSGCQVKKYEKTDSFVCVCNQEYCDPLPVEPFSSPESLTIFTSDKSYYRLTKSVVPESGLKVNQSSDIKVTLNIFDRFQSIIGFGGAFTDSSGININRLTSEALKDRLIADYFGKDGAEYSTCRVPIGGSDFSDRPYSYDDDAVDDFELKHFSLADDDHNYKIPYIKKALKFNDGLKLFGSAWAPPAWLKTNNATNGLGILIGEPGSIHWKTWANYFVKFFDSYKENGIEFWGLTPQNEPLSGFKPNFAWNNCGFTSHMMRDFIKEDLGPALKAAGYGVDKLKLMIYDTNTDGVDLYVRVVLSDKDAASYISGVAYHWYLGHYYDNLNTVHDEFPDLFLMSTEACEGWVRTDPDVGVTLGNWTRAETYADDIIEGLNHGSSGWVDWNLALNEEGGPNWAKNIVDAPIIVSDDGTEYYKQPMFYSLAHFSKFLKPGSQRIHHHIDKGRMDGVKMITFVTPTNDLVIVVLNTNSDYVQITFNGAGPSKFTLEFSPSSIQTIIKPLD